MQSRWCGRQRLFALGKRKGRAPNQRARLETCPCTLIPTMRTRRFCGGAARTCAVSATLWANLLPGNHAHPHRRRAWHLRAGWPRFPAEAAVAPERPRHGNLGGWSGGVFLVRGSRIRAHAINRAEATATATAKAAATVEIKRTMRNPSLCAHCLHRICNDCSKLFR
jgi:hypothetical protein